MKKLTAILIPLALSGCGEPVSQPGGMLSESLNCPEGSTGYIDRYGGIGSNQWVHSCKKNDGAFHVWHNEVLIIEGTYRDGKEVGKWVYRDKNGNIKETIIFDSK